MQYIKHLTFFILYFLVSFASSEVINKIEIQGLNTISRGTVLNYLPYEINDNVEQDDLLSIDKKLTDLDFFQSVKVSLNNNILKINLVERPTIKFFDFIGFDNGLVLSDDLVDKIKENSGLKVGKIYSQARVEKLIKELLNLYKTNAFYNAEISFKTYVDDSNRIGVELIFNENNPALIEKVNISGNKIFDTEEIIDILGMGEADFFIINYWTEHDRFDKNKFDAALESIKSKYLNLGYLDAKILKSGIKLSQDKKSIQIFIDISEGQQYFINTISFSGDIDDTKESLLHQTFGIKPGDIFSTKNILTSINNIRELYSDIGYAYAEVQTNVQKIKDKTSYDLNVIISKKPLVYVNRIEINGNNRTQDDVIRREFLLLEGQIFSQKNLDESINRIKRLGYFSDVKVETVASKNSSDKVNILVNVVETKTGEFSLGVSHSNATGPAFSTSITQSNILGTGNTFNGKFINSSAVSELSFYFSNPYFTKNGEYINYGVFNKKNDAEGLDAGSYIIDEKGVNLGYGVPTDKDTDISASIKLTSIDLTCGSVFSSVGYEQEQCSSNDNFDSILSLSYTHNSLNDYFAPTSGSKSSFKTSLAIPAGDFQYYKLENFNSFYSPINDFLTFNLKGNFQLAEGYGNKELPFYKRFYGGGSSSVRGFNFNSLGSKYANNTPKGGELSFLASSSIITPGKKIGIDNENIRLAGFVDTGSISDKLSEFDFSDLRMSYGIAMSWITPVGPIGIHYAIPIIKKTGDSVESFSFQLGTNF